MLIVVVCAPLFVLAWRPGWSLPMPVSWLLFAAVMWTAHLTSFYDAALDNANLHAFEHFVFLGASIAFWMPVISGSKSYPLRLAYLALSLPQQAFLALAIYSASTPLYEHYADLDDQKAGAIVMWVGGDMAFIIAIAIVIGAWMRAERDL
jgi:cytochrome c oxidase assembly factor CtaG